MFEITDYYELNALNIALHEARYHENPDHREVAASPFVAEIHERVLAALFTYNNTPKSKIDDWLLWSNRTIENERVRHHLTQCDWGHLPSDIKRDVVKTMVRPFVATEQEIDTLIEYADKHASGDFE